MALTGRFTEHHALLRRLHRDHTVFDDAVDGLDKRIAREGGALAAGGWPDQNRPGLR
jgi:hypothetical protein